MSLLDALMHLLNFFGPAVGVGMMAALLAKILWFRELSQVRWQRLAAWAVLSSAAALLVGLLLIGRDGKMVSYGAMALSCALALWWAGWKSARP